MFPTHYAVTARLPSSELAVEYLDWLGSGGHLQAVIDGGASSACAVRLDPAPHESAMPVRIMSLYTFPSREAFAAYERDHAPALRADGVARFGDRGIEFERTTGEIVTALGS